MNENNKIDHIIERIASLPTLPSVVVKINELVRNPKASVSDLGKVISADQSLTAKILKLVNSAFFGFPGEIKSISHAIVILGFKTIQNIALSVSVFDLFEKNKTGSLFDRKEFWKHSIGCAASSRLIASKLRYDDVDLAFTSGLLHDIGKVILDQYLHDDFIKVLKALEEKSAYIYDMELEILGFSHAQLGGKLASLWRLPKVHIDSIAQHHHPEKNPDADKLIYIVHMADVICNAKGIGQSGNTRKPSLRKEIVEELGLSALDLELILQQVQTEVDKASDFLKLTVS